jgi:hypothetical protein
MGKELSKLLATGFVKEVQHSDWIANPFLVPKKNGKWRMCVDYASLNKACPKDPFPLQRINHVMDLTAQCELLSFVDAYSGYHQTLSLRYTSPPPRSLLPLGVFAT